MECRHGRLRGDRLPVAANPLWPHDYPCGCYPGETPQIGSSPSKNGNGRLTDNTKALARLREGLAEAGIELDEGAPAPANGKLNGSGARGPHSRTLRDPSLG